jgi:DNA-binding MarR family transcriptional regulator
MPETEAAVAAIQSLESTFVDRVGIHPALVQAASASDGSGDVADGIVERIHLLGRHLDTLRGRVTAPYQLTARDFDILARLYRSGEPYRLTPTHLAIGTAAPATTVTSRLDRLERRGLIARVADPNDRRSLLAELTAEGRALFRRVVVDQRRQEAELFGELPSGQLEQFHDLLGTMLIGCQSRLGRTV